CGYPLAEATRHAVYFNGEGEALIERVGGLGVDIQPPKSLETLWIPKVSAGIRSKVPLIPMWISAR
ncbi:hypothetical protein, partial [Burkholderia stagnalis]|uniref:hypothetical protein n=1 Tax=Burkholderia stagnalis TaxID=1503054 RepID=UPI001C8A425C